MTITEKAVHCPVCGGEVIARQVSSMTVSGTYLDFQKKVNGPYYFVAFSSCPVCHFSGYASDFSRWASIWLSKDIKRKVLNELKPIVPDPNNYDVFKFAAKIYEWKKKDYEAIAQIYLFGSYYLKYHNAPNDKRSENQCMTEIPTPSFWTEYLAEWGKKKPLREELRKRYQALACEYLIKALETKKIKEKARGNVCYLIGELYRRQGEFEKAITWYDDALKENNPDGFKDTIHKQREMAQNRDDDNNI